MATGNGFVEFTPSGKRVTHGGAGTAYAAYGCRCIECVEANRERARKGQAKRQEAREAGADLKHGLVSTYTNYGCRCDECKAAQVAKCGRYYDQKLSAEVTGSVPRQPIDIERTKTEVLAFIDKTGRIPARATPDLTERKLGGRFWEARYRRKEEWAIEIYDANKPARGRRPLTQTDKLE